MRKRIIIVCRHRAKGLHCDDARRRVERLEMSFVKYAVRARMISIRIWTVANINHSSVCPDFTIKSMSCSVPTTRSYRCQPLLRYSNRKPTRRVAAVVRWPTTSHITAAMTMTTHLPYFRRPKLYPHCSNCCLLHSLNSDGHVLYSSIIKKQCASGVGSLAATPDDTRYMKILINIRRYDMIKP